MSKKMSARVPVSMRAVLQRINRKLAKDDEQLKTSRSERMAQSVGWYYVIDFNRNVVLHHDVDPTEVAKELGVLAQWECVEQEG